MTTDDLSMLIKKCLQEVIQEEFEDDETWQGTLNVRETDEDVPKAIKKGKERIVKTKYFTVIYGENNGLVPGAGKIMLGDEWFGNIFPTRWQGGKLMWAFNSAMGAWRVKYQDKTPFYKSRIELLNALDKWYQKTQLTNTEKDFRG